MTTRAPFASLPPEEQKRLLQQVTYRGHRWLANRLGMDPDYIWRLASEAGYTLGDTRRTRLVTEVAVDAGLLPGAVAQRAERDGVLRRLGTHGKRRVVPRKWAEELIQEQTEATANAEKRDAGWLQVEEVAEQLSVHVGSVRRWLEGRGVLADLAEPPEFVRARALGRDGGQYFLVNPFDVDATRVILDRARWEAEGHISENSFREELGIGRHRLQRLIRKYGSRQKRFLNDRLAWAVPPHVARKVRQEVKANPRWNGNHHEPPAD